MKNKTKNKWGGVRPNSGRPKNPQRQEFLKVLADIKNHANKTVGLVDKKTKEVIKKKRIIFLLDTLWTLAVNEKNVFAIREYFDRAIGKSRQYVEVDNSRQEEIDKLGETLNYLIDETNNKDTTRPVQNRRKERKRSPDKRAS